MKKTLIAIITTIGLLFAGYASLFMYTVTKQDAESLLVCADTDDVFIIPFAKNICRAYLFTLRGTQQDIDFLHGGIGASSVVQGESSVAKREQILKFLISKGLDVNRIDMHQLTPLHGAVLANSVDEVEILLRNGASPNLKDKKFGLTPLELALKLDRENKLPEDRRAVISLLRNAK